MISSAHLLAALLFLGVFWIVDTSLLSVCRRFSFSDFIAHVLTGAILGFLQLLIPSGYFGGGFPDLFQNPLLNSLSSLGLFLFFLQLGFVFDPSLLRLSFKNSIKSLSILLVFTVLVLGSGVYVFIVHNTFAVLAILIAFLGINVGPMLSGLFPDNPSLKKYSRGLMELALILDVTAVLLYAVLDTYLQNRYLALSGMKWGGLGLLILFTLLIVLYSRRAGKTADRPVAETSLGTGWVLGGYFILLAVGLFSPISTILIAVWFGFILRTVLGTKAHLIRKQLFQAFSVLTILPFIHSGYESVLQGTPSLNFWLFLFVFLILWIGVNFLYGVFMNRLENTPILISLGVFPKGDLTILLLWLAYRLDLFSAVVLASSAAVVIFTSLLGRYFFIRPLKSE